MGYDMGEQYGEASAEDVEWEIGYDHQLTSVATWTVLLHRDMGTYREAMWLRGYPTAKLIVASTLPTVIASGPNGGAELPGIVVEIPVGWRDTITDYAFTARCEKEVTLRIKQGWTRKHTNGVWSGDPWDTGSSLDAEPNF